jgi:lysophospholipase L1-like esterase
VTGSKIPDSRWLIIDFKIPQVAKQCELDRLFFIDEDHVRKNIHLPFGLALHAGPGTANPRPMETNLPSRPSLSPGKRWLFRAIILSVIVGVGLVGAETILRRQQTEIARSNQVDPGLVKYDPELGWRLDPYWSGGHKHHDFSVRYAINSRGFRADTPNLPRKSGRKLTIALGDSYTFGYGVNDDETFVHRLDAQAAGGFDYLNAGIPGFSTDQEALLLEKELLALGPRRVLLFVYVGNDLLDLPREVPLQLRTPKPRFEAVAGELVLRNVPVPAKTDARVEPWWPVVLGPDPSRWSWRTRLDLRYELFRLASPPFPSERDYRPEFAARFAPALTLFELIVDRMAKGCARREAELMVILIASGSYLHSPKSPSAQYQDFFCQEIAQRLRKKAIPVIHLPALMKERFRREGGSWFFPNEGHLNATGHQVVAELLAAELTRAEPRPVR